jgi:MATE family multidrug resistance protein
MERLHPSPSGKGTALLQQVASEAKKQVRLAVPLIVGCLLQNVIQMISVMFVGHLGELALASASMATSFAIVTGFSFLVHWFTDTRASELAPTLLY